MKMRVEAILQRIRPYLAIDGGGIEYVGFDRDRAVVEVRLTGACAACAMSYMTLRAGVEGALLGALPEVKRVEAVRDGAPQG